MLYKDQIFFSTKLFSPISECLTKQTLYMPHTNLHKKKHCKVQLEDLEYKRISRPADWV